MGKQSAPGPGAVGPGWAAVGAGFGLDKLGSLIGRLKHDTGGAVHVRIKLARSA
jgi:hypothetical protein